MDTWSSSDNLRVRGLTYALRITPLRQRWKNEAEKLKAVVARAKEYLSPFRGGKWEVYQR